MCVCVCLSGCESVHARMYSPFMRTCEFFLHMLACMFGSVLLCISVTVSVCVLTCACLYGGHARVLMYRGNFFFPASIFKDLFSVKSNGAAERTGPLPACSTHSQLYRFPSKLYFVK